MDKFDLSGRVAIITGASAGIGRKTALVLAEHNAQVFVVARRENLLRELKNEITKKGGICEYMVCDLSTEDGCRLAVETCVKTFGRLDILVNNAGSVGESPNAPLEKQFNTDNVRFVMDLDFFGVLWMIKYSYEECAKHGVGSIINLSSTAAMTATGPIIYTAAKGAIKSMTLNLAKHFGPLRVRINSIYPGLIRTEATSPALNTPEFAQYARQLSVFGEVGEPDDIAYGVLYLASDASSFVTGQDLVIDGGCTCLN